MPYITPDRRKDLAQGEVPQNPGELNYAITAGILWYLSTHGLNYRTINDIVGALEGAKAEFQRRVTAPYEDKKKEENGDVYFTH